MTDLERLLEAAEAAFKGGGRPYDDLLGALADALEETGDGGDETRAAAALLRSQGHVWIAWGIRFPQLCATCSERQGASSPGERCPKAAAKGVRLARELVDRERHEWRELVDRERRAAYLKSKYGGGA